eukprot:scaffold8353_cov138-Cylindrotheca_fusiformis.AAC.10
MDMKMEVDQPKPAEQKEPRVLIHPLAVVHMSDQYTRISCGGSPLDTDAQVVGLLFGESNEVLQIQDADDIPPETSEQTQIQVDLHLAVFPQHSVVGWYRVTKSEQEARKSDLQTTKLLKEHFAPSSPFCFCLLQIQQDKKQDGRETVVEELPISLYELHDVDNQSILLGLSDWKLETSEPERIAVERVMKQDPLDLEGNMAHNQYVATSKSIQVSLSSMKERIELLITFLKSTQEGRIPPSHRLLRRVQVLLYSLGPLGDTVKKVGSTGGAQDAEVLSHLAAAAKTLSAAQSYTDKFRLVHENGAMSKEMRRAF